MPDGIALEAVETGGPPRINIEVTGLHPGHDSIITIARSWDQGNTWHPVRGAWRVAVRGEGFFYDHTPPLNVPALYRLTVHSGQRTPTTLEAVAVATSPNAWLHDPLDPRTPLPLTEGRQADAVALVSASPATYGQAIDYALPLGASVPVASIGPRLAAAGIDLHLRLLPEQTTLHTHLRRLLSTAGQIVITGLDPRRHLEHVMHVSVGDITESTTIGGILGVFTDLHLTVNAVRPLNLRIAPPVNTFADVQNLIAQHLGPQTTNADIAANIPTDLRNIDARRDPNLLLGDSA